MGLLTQSEIESQTRINDELVACGIICDGVGSDGIISGLQPEQADLAALVMAARDKILTSPECLAVRAALGGAADPRWIVYKAVRQNHVKRNRAQEFVLEFLLDWGEILYTATPRVVAEGIFLGFDAAKLQALKAKIDAIKAKFPDEA